MNYKNHHFLGFACYIFVRAILIALLSPLFPYNSFAVTLVLGQNDYVTTGDITTNGIGISSSLSGSTASLNKITNLHIISTGAGGLVSGAYGIRATGSYNHITNTASGKIITTGSSGRGISITNNSVVDNFGNITTNNSNSYGIYAGGDKNTLNNFGSINTSSSSAYGIYLNGNNNYANNYGLISANVYGIYSAGDTNSITNRGIIGTSNSSSAHGIFVSSGSSSNANSISYSTITNEGFINSSGHGIYNKDKFTVINNAGQISVNGSSSINAVRNEGDYAIINNGGLLKSNLYSIYNLGIDVVINNYGNIEGGVFLDSGVLNLIGGSLSGVIDANLSDSTINIGNAVTTFEFNQTGKINNAQFIKISSGSTLNSYSSITAGQIAINDAATLNLYSNSAIDARIIGGFDGVGNVNIFGNQNLKNGLGSSGNSLNEVNIKSSSITSIAGDINSTLTKINGIVNFQNQNSNILGALSVGDGGKINIGYTNLQIADSLLMERGSELSVSFSDASSGLLSVGKGISFDAAKININYSGSSIYRDVGTYKIISGSGLNNQEISKENFSINQVSSSNYGIGRFGIFSNSDGVFLRIDKAPAKDISASKKVQNIYEYLGEVDVSGNKEIALMQSYLSSNSVSLAKIEDSLGRLLPYSIDSIITSVNLSLDASNLVILDRLRSREMTALSRIDKNKDNLWFEAYGGSVSQKKISDLDAFGVNNRGFLIGYDSEFNSSTLFGSSLGFTRSDLKYEDDSKVAILDNYQVSLYGGYADNQNFLNLSSSFALSSMNLSRSMYAIGLSNQANFLASSYNIVGKYGYITNLGLVDLVPYVSLSRTQNLLPGYKEQGAGSLDLQVKSVKVNSNIVKIGSDFVIESLTSEIFPSIYATSILARVFYGRTLENSYPSMIVRFVGQDIDFQIPPSKRYQNSIGAGLGFALYHSDDFRIDLNCDFEATKIRAKYYSSLRISQRF